MELIGYLHFVLAQPGLVAIVFVGLDGVDSQNLNPFLGRLLARLGDSGIFARSGLGIGSVLGDGVGVGDTVRGMVVIVDVLVRVGGASGVREGAGFGLGGGDSRLGLTRVGAHRKASGAEGSGMSRKGRTGRRSSFSSSMSVNARLTVAYVTDDVSIFVIFFQTNSPVPRCRTARTIVNSLLLVPFEVGMKNARSSSFTTLPGRISGHVRRTSRNHVDLNPLDNTSPNAAPLLDAGPNREDFSPRGPVLPRSRSHIVIQPKRPRDPRLPSGNKVMRPNKSAQRLLADARMAVKVRTRSLFPRRVLIALVFLFLSLFAMLFSFLKRTYGIVRQPPPSSFPNARSNAARIADGLPPEEYWPSGRTRLRHQTPISKPLDILDVQALRNRGIPSSSDYRSLSPTSTFPVRLSLIAACRDRTAFLQSSLPTWLDALAAYDEIVLVDWGTDSETHVPLMAAVEATKDSRISLITVRDTASWVLSRAYNLALDHARGEWVLKVDCDTTLNSNFLDSVSLSGAPVSVAAPTTNGPSTPASPATPIDNSEKRHYYRFLQPDIADGNDRYLSGVFLAHSYDLRAVHGFDERLTTYGWESNDLYERFERSSASKGRALLPRSFKSGSLSHIRHTGRDHQSMSGGPEFQAELNRRALLALSSWASENRRCSYAHRIASNDGRYVFSEAQVSIPSAMDQLVPSMRESVLAAAREHVLHTVYGIPLEVIGEINRSRAELVRELARIRSKASWVPGNGIIFADISGTTAQRLLGVAVAVSIASKSKRPLFIAWRPDDTKLLGRDPRLDGVLDINSASDHGAHVYQLGAWPCRHSTTDECASFDVAYKRIVTYDGEKDFSLIEAGIDKNPKDNVLLRFEGAVPMLGRKRMVEALRILRPAPRLAQVLQDKAKVLGETQGVYIGPKLRAHSIDAIAKRLRNGGSNNSTPPAYFVVGGDRVLVRMARRALESDLAINGNGHKFEGAALEFAELFALAYCRVVVNDGRIPHDVFEAVAIIRESELKS